MDLALNNLQRLICHKTQQTKPIKQEYNTLLSLSWHKATIVWCLAMNKFNTLGN